jgi:hypothetical protein
VGAVQEVEEALRVALTVFEFWSNCLPVAGCHHHPPLLEGERNDLPASLQCHRPNHRRKLRSEVPYTANFGEPPQRTGRAAVWSAGPRSESPLTVRSTVHIRSHRTPLIGLFSALDPQTDGSDLMKSP